MQAGFFEKQIVLTPDLCGSAAALSPLAAFTIFQGIASEHAERIGVGGAAMALATNAKPSHSTVARCFFRFISYLSPIWRVARATGRARKWLRSPPTPAFGSSSR